MKKYLQIIIKFRWAIVVLIPLLTVFLSLQLKHIQFDGSYRVWFAEGSSTLKNYDNFKNVFGNDDALIITFQDINGVINKKALLVIERLTKKLWETRFIARVDSLTNYQYIHVSPKDKDEIIVENFIENIEKLSPQELAEKKLIALNEDMLKNRIISADGTTTMIVARITPKASTVPGAVKILNDLVVKYIEEEKESGYAFHLAGGPILNMTFARLGQHDALVFTPIILLIVMVLLFMIFRSASGVFLSLSIVIFTFIIVLSMQVIFGFKLNNFTANIPVFIVAIGIADAMHIFWIYLLGRKKGLENEDAIYYTLEKNIVPIFFTSMTTAVGFASLGISDITPIKTLGIATANAALIAFVLSILFVPAMLVILNPKIKKVQSTSGSTYTSFSFASKYAWFIIHQHKRILVASLLLCLLLGMGLTRLTVDSNTVRYFTEDVPFRQTVHFIEEKLTGPMNYEIVIDSQKKDGIKNPSFMKKVESFEEAFKKKFSDVRHTSSLLDIVKKFSEVIDGKKEIPETQELIAQYLLLYSFSLPQGMEINDKMDIDEQRLRLTASMNIVDTSLDLEMIQWVETWWAQTEYTAKVNGQTAMFAHMQHDVTSTLIQSILLAITLVSFMMLFIFKSIKMIPLFIIPNVLPIILVMGVMGWLGISIDIGVAISGAIIIGVAVDDTIHFLIKYREAREKGYSLHDTLVYIMKYAGASIIFTTIILSSAFMIFAFSQFNPNVHFGIVTAIALLIAVLVDLFMLPALLTYYDRKNITFIERKENA